MFGSITGLRTINSLLKITPSMSSFFQKRSIVNVRELKGSYDAFNKMKQLSPVFGAVLNYTRIIYQFYQKPITEIKLPATQSLVRELFHLEGNQFRETHCKSLAAYYLTPKLIAKILYYLTTNTLAEPDVRRILYEDWKNLHDKESGKKISTSKIDVFLDKILASQKECLIEQPSVIMTETILLALLHQKSDSRQEIIQYFEELAQLDSTIINKEKVHTTFSPFNTTDVTLNNEKLRKIATAHIPPEVLIKTIQKNYENFLLSMMLHKNSLCGITVKYYSFNNKTQKPDCMETALRNLYNILLLDEDNETFSFKQLPLSLQARINPKWLSFYEEFDFAIDKVNSRFSGQAFFNMLSANLEFKYISYDYELDATTDNFLAVTNYLFGTNAHTLQALSRQFSDDKRQVIFTQEKEYISILIKRINEIEKIKLVCMPGRHAELQADRFSINHSFNLNVDDFDLRFIESLPLITHQYPIFITLMNNVIKKSLLIEYLFNTRIQDASVIKILLEAGADPNVIDDDYLNRVPLSYAKSALVVKLLYAAGANPNETDPKGATPLHVAYNNEVACALIAAGANPNAADECGWTPLHYHRKNISITITLLSAHANPNALDTEGRTPLHCSWNVEVVNALLSAGANPNITNKLGETPLHNSHKGGYSVIKTLLKAGANPYLKNKNGLLPIDMTKNNDIINLLKTAMTIPFEERFSSSQNMRC